MEGDPIFEPGRSLEYLFGCWLPGDESEFRAFWGLDRDQEKRAFEGFVDFIAERRRRHPAMHVYHYANYEKEALRRLAQQHCTREAEVDDLLRGEVLVDLFAVVRRAVAIWEESYSLKSLERFYDLARETIVKKGNESIVMFETWRAGGDREILEDIERYNRDDCRSTYLLREWLLDRRSRGHVALRNRPAVSSAKVTATNHATPSFSLRARNAPSGRMTHARKRSGATSSVRCSPTCCRRAPKKSIASWPPTGACVISSAIF